MEKKFRNELLEKLENQNVTLTLDHWSSVANENYTGLTAHWIDENWKLCNAQLGCFLHSDGSDSKSLLKNFFEFSKTLF